VKSGNGHTTVAVKNSNIGWVVAIVVAVVMLGGIGSMGQVALSGAGAAADSLTPTLSPPGNANNMNKQAQQHATPTTVPTVSDEEMAKRGQAKTLGDQLPKPATVTPNPGVPTLANPSGGGSGILGELPVVGGAIQGAVKALGPGGLKALNP